MDIQTATTLSLEGLPSTTARTYHYGQTLFFGWLEDEYQIKLSNDVIEITMEHFIRFPLWLAGFELSKGTKLNYTYGVRKLMKWLEIQNFMSPTLSDYRRYTDAVQTIRGRNQHLLPDIPKQDDIDKILDILDRVTFPSPTKERNKALILFLLTTGCRNNEVAKLTIAKLDTKRCIGKVRGKGDKDRPIYFSPLASLALEAYWTARGWRDGNDPVFARHTKNVGTTHVALETWDIRSIVKTCAKIADVVGIHPHSFRHAAAMRLLKSSGNIEVVRKYLGHKRLETTSIYAEAFDEDVRQATKEAFK